MKLFPFGSHNNDEVLGDVEMLYEVDENGNVLPVITYADGDELLHTDECPQCSDPTCPCHAGEKGR